MKSNNKNSKNKNETKLLLKEKYPINYSAPLTLAEIVSNVSKILDKKKF